MLENLKLFIDTGPQDIGDYGWDGSSISQILAGPRDASIPNLIVEWREKTWQPRMYTRKGVTKPGKQKLPTVSFQDWLVSDKNFHLLDSSQWEMLDYF